MATDSPVKDQTVKPDAKPAEDAPKVAGLVKGPAPLPAIPAAPAPKTETEPDREVDVEYEGKCRVVLQGEHTHDGKEIVFVHGDVKRILLSEARELQATGEVFQIHEVDEKSTEKSSR